MSMTMFMLCISTVAVGMQMLGIGVRSHLALNPAQVGVSENLFGYVVPAGWFLAPRVPGIGAPFVSDLIVYEDGRALGPANANPAVIEKKGAGRFRHFGTARDQHLYFSTSDNSDVRENGRSYSISYTQTPSDLLVATLCGATALLVLLTTGLAIARAFSDGFSQWRDPRVRACSAKCLSRIAWGSGLVLTLPVLFMTIFDTGIRTVVPLSWDQMGIAGKVAGVPIEANWLFESHAESSTRADRSDLVVLEDGIPLGPAHTPSIVIQEQGGGRYLHWGAAQQFLNFSSSDNTDPSTNEREYRLEYSLFPTRFLMLISVLLPIAAWFASRILVPGLSGQVNPWLVCLAVALVFGGAMSAASHDTKVVALENVRDPVELLASLIAGVIVSFYAARHFAEHRRFPFAASVSLLAFGSNLFYDQVAGFVIGMVTGLLASLPAVERGLRNALRHVDLTRAFSYRGLMICACVFTVVNVAPEFVDFWDSSGWMDSNSYDKLAWSIARGVNPAGSSYYMPVYQYGMAVLYWMFGHEWRVQQIVNLALALASVILVFDVGYRLSTSLLTAFAAALFVAFHPLLHHAVWYTQIENWLIPSFALSLWCLVRYVLDPTRRNVLWLAVAAALLFNMRLQNAFYCALIGAAVLVPYRVATLERAKHLVAFCVVLALVGIAPWSVRNFVVEGRLSPGSAQSAESIAVTNDPRIGFYGLRYHEGYYQIAQEWIDRVPNAKERYAQQMSYFRERLVSDPEWFGEAIKWRTAAFYGLAPSSVWAPEGPQPFDWSSGFSGYWAQAHHYVPVLVASAVAVIASPWRLYVLLAGLVVSNLALVVFSGFAEPRLCYPVLLLHGVMAMLPFHRPNRTATYLAGNPVHVSRRRLRTYAVAAVATVGVGFALHHFVGSSRLYRPLDASYVRFDPALEIDKSLPQLDLSAARPSIDGERIDGAAIGRTVRATFVTDSGMLPARYSRISVGVPEIARSSRSRPFFFAWPSDAPGRFIPVRYERIEADQRIREAMLVEAELEVVAEGNYVDSGLWLNAKRVKVLKAIAN